VALDGVTDPRNLGAVVRSAAAFGSQGVIVPERRAAGMTASAWKVSAGAAARVPVARVTNLNRALAALKDKGLVVVGLAAEGDTELADLDALADGVVLVVGSEGKCLSRLVGEACDYTVRIPIASSTESLNAGVAAGIVLYEAARRRSS
jgi:23S rRNA (guanosine2251-2'-O)-methyltransferase